MGDEEASARGGRRTESNWNLMGRENAKRRAIDRVLRDPLWIRGPRTRAIHPLSCRGTARLADWYELAVFANPP